MLVTSEIAAVIAETKPDAEQNAEKISAVADLTASQWLINYPRIWLANYSLVHRGWSPIYYSS